MLRYKDENAVKNADYMQERLALALRLSDLAFGEGKTMRPIDLDHLRDMRAKHGCGFFQNETEEDKQAIQSRFQKS